MMNHGSLRQFAVGFNVRQWFGHKPSSTATPANDTAATAAAPCALPVAATPTPEPAKPTRVFIPRRARNHQIDPTLRQWYAAQPHPCTIVAFVNNETGKITQFNAIAGNHIRNLFTTPTAMTDNTEWSWVNPHCLRGTEPDWRDCAQAANPSVYELLQLRKANQHTIAELADLERDIHQAFLNAFYRDSANVEINAATAPTPPQEGALEELRGLLDADNCIHQQLTDNLAAFNRAWQAMALDESGTAPMPNQVISYAEE